MKTQLKYRLSQTQMLWLIFLALLTFSSNDLFGQLLHFNLQNREYRLEGDKWYIFLEGKKGDEIIPQRLVVRMKDRGFIENFDFKRFDISDVSIDSRRFLDGYYVLQISTKGDPFEIAFTLESTGQFDVLEFDVYGTRNAVPNDPLYPNQWNFPKIQMPQAWDITTGNNTMILAIIDSGTRYTHEDLDGSIWENPGETGMTAPGSPCWTGMPQDKRFNNCDDDDNGFIDDWHGWDFAGGGNNPQPPYIPDNDPGDTDGHGTNVAGIMSAQTNNYESGSYRGIAGVAGGWGAQSGSSLMVLRDGGVRTIASVTIQAVEYAAENGAKVINISSGFSPPAPTGMANAINLAVYTYGVVVVASSGNNGDEEDASLRYPARFSNTIAVGATDQNDNHRSYSAYGSQMDIVAPDGVPTTTMAGGYTNSVTGTSFSAPHVAGVAALIRSLNTSLSWQQVRDQLRLSADKVPGMDGEDFTDEYGYGRLNANKAVRNMYVPQVYPNIASAVSAAVSGQTIYVSSGNYTLTSNIIIPSGVMLTLLSGANVNFNGRYIDATNGVFNIQNGSTVYVTNGNKRYYGLFTSVQSAMNFASSGRTVQLLSMAYTGNLSFSSKSNVTLKGQGQGSTTLNGSISVTNSSSITVIRNS